jgi:type II secretory pathway pseudopilin PulG
MTTRILRSNAGFTYIAALVMVVIMGIMLSQAAVVWKTKMQREKEAELLYRGTQIRDAMRLWYKFKVPTAGAPQQAPPATPPLNDLKDLLQDPNNSLKVRYLRPSNLIDPITKKDWGVIKDGQKIIGVASTSEAEPIKQGNFPDDFTDFEGKKKYSEWQFIYNRIPQKVTGGSISGGGAGQANPTSPNPTQTPTQ